MKRTLTALGATLAMLLAAPLAGAQQGKGNFGEQGQFIFSADRLFGLFTYAQQTISDNANNTSTTVSGTSMSFLWGSNAFGGGVAATTGVPTFYTVPRVGFDYTIIPNLTVGGDLIAFFTLGGNTSKTGAPSTPNQSGDVFGLAPRVGYILGLNDIFSVWLRGGLSFYAGNINNQVMGANCNASTGFDVFGIDLDPQLVISPIRHVAFTAGPALDWGFTGGTNSSSPPACNTTVGTGFTSLDFSINGGLLLWL